MCLLLYRNEDLHPYWPFLDRFDSLALKSMGARQVEERIHLVVLLNDSELGRGQAETVDSLSERWHVDSTRLFVRVRSVMRGSDSFIFHSSRLSLTCL